MKKLFLVPTAVLMLGSITSCSSNGDPDPEPTPSVKFSVDMSTYSRAGDNYFENGDRIGIFAVAAQGGTPSMLGDNNRFNNVCHVYDGSHFNAAEGDGIVKAYDESLAYVAVYPYSTSLGSEFTFTMAENQRADRNYTNSDLATAATGATTATDVSLTFYHRLSQIVINVTGDDLAGDLDLKLNNLKLQANVNLNDMKFEATGSASSSIIPANNGITSWKAVVAPQTFAAGTTLATVTFRGNELPLVPSADLTFVSGRSYEFTVTIVNDQVVEFTGDILPWNSGTIEDVVPEEVREQWGEYITIYDGITPPNIEGCYFVDPMTAVYCEDEGDGGFEPGTVVNSEFFRFRDQNTMLNTINMDILSVSGSLSSSGNGAFITGSGNNFTVFFNNEGSSQGIYTKTAAVISGTKTADGIQNLVYAFVMVDKGDDPEGVLMGKNVYRVFKDGDEIAVNAEWPNGNTQPRKKAAAGLDVFSRK